MQNWCPRAFDTASVAVYRGDGPSFESDSSLGAVAVLVDDEERTFRTERSLGDPTAIMANLSPLERTTVCELVEQDVSRSYAEREQALRAEIEAARQAELAELRREHEAFAASWAAADEQRMRALAAAAARLALQVAGKLVRRTVASDPEVLVRAIETVFFSANTREPLAVTVHPDDAAWLEQAPAVRERLRIGNVVADRRIERGGCLLAADGREWDATLGSQLDSLGEVIEEWLSVVSDTDQAGAGDER